MAASGYLSSRRSLLLGGLSVGLVAGLVAPCAAAGDQDAAQADAPAFPAGTDARTDMAFVVPAGEAVRIERFSVYGHSLAAMEVPRVIRTDTQWRVHLSDLAYEVTRQGGSEPAFSGRYLRNRAAGLYRCICCGTALFDSRSRFEPASGWLTFHTPVSAYNVVESLPSDADTAGDVHHLTVSCRRCDAHVGEVFDDGPPPTELRYRIDSVALYFVAYPPY